MGEHHVRQRQHAPPQPPRSMVSRIGPVGDAAIDEKQGRAKALGFSKQVGPELGFHHQKRCRPQAPQKSAADPREIQGREEHSIGRQQLAGRRPAGSGGGSEDKSDLRVAALQCLDQRLCGFHLAKGNGVQPDNRAREVPAEVGKKSQALR